MISQKLNELGYIAVNTAVAFQMVSLDITGFDGF
jgi:hypothetical protein